MATPEILLTEEQRLEFTQISHNINEWEIAKYYTLSGVPPHRHQAKRTKR